MSHDDAQLDSENWREIAARVTDEKDPNKIVQLANELINALDEKVDKLSERASLNKKSDGQDA